MKKHKAFEFVVFLYEHKGTCAVQISNVKVSYQQIQMFCIYTVCIPFFCRRGTEQSASQTHARRLCIDSVVYNARFHHYFLHDQWSAECFDTTAPLYAHKEEATNANLSFVCKKKKICEVVSFKDIFSQRNRRVRFCK